MASVAAAAHLSRGGIGLLDQWGVNVKLEIDLPGGKAEIRGVAEAVQSLGPGGVRYSVDDNGVIYIQSGNRRELMRGSRIRWRLKQITENEVAR